MSLASAIVEVSPEQGNSTSYAGYAQNYAGLSNVWGISNSGENPQYDAPQETTRLTRTSEAIDRFLRTLETQEKFGAVVGRAVGIFDGQLYLWVITEALDTDLTRSIFETKIAIEQEIGSEFEVHVEPRGHSSVPELIPSGYLAI